MKDSKIIVGVKTVILGLSFYIIELLLLPVFGALQKAQVGGQGFYTDFMRYAEEQPYPIIFILTAAIIVIGIALIVWGLREKK